MSTTQRAKQTTSTRTGGAGKTLAKKSGRGISMKKAMISPSRVKAVRSKFGLKQTQMSRLLGISPRKLSELESQTKAPRPETKRRLTEVDRLRKAIDEIMDTDDIAPWMEEPNDAFEGSTPLQLVERGEIDRLWQMIYAVRTGHPL